MGTIFTRKKPFIPSSGTIGVCATAPNSGATHLCIALANFLCSKFCSRTAYLEMNGSHQICSLAGKQNPRMPFVHQRITYYPGVTLDQMQKVLSKHYKYFVLDFGCANPHTAQAFAHCDIRLVIGCISPWKNTQYMKAVQTFCLKYRKEGGIVYLGNLSWGRKINGQLEKCCDIQIVPVPFLPNPFRVTSDEFTFFEDILKGN